MSEYQSRNKNQSKGTILDTLKNGQTLNLMQIHRLENSPYATVCRSPQAELLTLSKESFFRILESHLKR